MSRIWTSHRKRRRLIRGMVALVVLTVVGLLVAFLRNTAHQYPTTYRNEPAQVYHEPRAVRLTADERRTVHEVAVRFISTAVTRDDVDASWTLAAVELRQGFTRADWRKGDIPVTPYPADAPEYAPWKVLFSYADDVLVRISLLARHNQTAYRGGQTFAIELKRQGAGPLRAWRVLSFLPYGGGNVDLSQAKQALLGPPPPPIKSPLGAGWLLVPAGVLAALLLIPVALALREWRRGVRARRAYAPREPNPF
jgi:hypothetical protein